MVRTIKQLQSNTCIALSDPALDSEIINPMGSLKVSGKLLKANCSTFPRLSSNPCKVIDASYSCKSNLNLVSMKNERFLNTHK